MIRVLALLIVSIALSGCAALNIKRGLADDDLQSTKRIGVVSLLGDTFHRVSIGMTVFNNTKYSSPVPDWKIDSYTSRQALDLLGSNTRFTSSLVDRTSMPKEQLAKEDEKKFWEAATQQGFDRLLIIRPSVSDNNAFFQPGFGIFERSVFGTNRRCVYAAYVVEVYDVASRKPIAWQWGGSEPCELGRDTDVPLRPNYSDYSAAELATIRKRLEARIDESLRYTLTKLSLIQMATATK
jgi:hypothetical protein